MNSSEHQASNANAPSGEPNQPRDRCDDAPVAADPMSGDYTARSRRRWLVPACLGVVGLGLIPFDGKISKAAIAGKEQLGGDLKRALETWQQFGDLGTVIFVVILIALLDPRRLRGCVRLGIAAGLAFLVVQGLKMGIGRPRPQFDEPWRFLFPWGTYSINEEIGPRHAWEMGSGISSDLWSMPSSHTAAAVVLGLFLAWMYPRLRGLVWFLIGVVGVSRVMLGAHYPSDVVMGAAVAIFVCGFVFRGAQKTVERDGSLESMEDEHGGSDSRSRSAIRQVVLVGVLLAALAGGGAVLWHKVIRHELFPRNFGVVVDGQIYRSGRLTERALRSLIEDREVRTILDLGAFDPDSEREAWTQDVAEELGVQRFRFSLIGDGTGNPNYYVQALRVMTDEQAWPLLVCCGAGSERTSVAVMLYRNLVDGDPMMETYAETFGYKHDREDWEMLAYLADYREAILESYRTGVPVEGFEAVAYPLGD